jgi:hypothetical protein
MTTDQTCEGELLNVGWLHIEDAQQPASGGNRGFEKPAPIFQRRTADLSASSKPCRAGIFMKDSKKQCQLNVEAGIVSRKGFTLSWV